MQPCIKFNDPERIIKQLTALETRSEVKKKKNKAKKKFVEFFKSSVQPLIKVIDPEVIFKQLAALITR